MTHQMKADLFLIAVCLAGVAVLVSLTGCAKYQYNYGYNRTMMSLQMLKQGDLSKIKPYDKGMIVAVTLWEQEQRKLIPPGCQIVGDHLQCQVPIKK